MISSGMKWSELSSISCDVSVLNAVLKLTSDVNLRRHLIAECGLGIEE